MRDQVGRFPRTRRAMLATSPALDPLATARMALPNFLGGFDEDCLETFSEHSDATETEDSGEEHVESMWLCITCSAAPAIGRSRIALEAPCHFGARKAGSPNRHKHRNPTWRRTSPGHHGRTAPLPDVQRHCPDDRY
eukprot:CAMPEP_0170625386 /NCGR_PEP_ID=MMETSP0224-20130122/30729_1 /TAXON_ID=285029 /ORGANISM="Togula jolla, Strain CCCM 725" /LENGTH=136 /DNA_ID=CAMNT_0010951953 /DNA_START=224 /DNA_END=635 /DNA_ORIENTATION=+